MLKVRIIPILTFNGLGLVKTKNFQNPRMVGNPVQSARVYNSRGVDELVFLDITASNQKRKINLKCIVNFINVIFFKNIYRNANTLTSEKRNCFINKRFVG